MSRKRIITCRVSIIIAALLCLLLSTSFFLGGLEATSENLPLTMDSLVITYPLLFEGALGIFCSAFSLINEVFVSRRRHLLLSAIGACFLVFQGLHILEFGAMLKAPLLMIAYAIPIPALSLLGLISNNLFSRHLGFIKV
jgi:hypothetical protein